MWPCGQAAKGLLYPGPPQVEDVKSARISSLGRGVYPREGGGKGAGTVSLLGTLTQLFFSVPSWVWMLQRRKGVLSPRPQTVLDQRDWPSIEPQLCAKRKPSDISPK